MVSKPRLLTLTSIAPTVLKRDCSFAVERLPIEQKRLFPLGTELMIDSFQCLGDALKLTLPDHTVWYAFAEHVQVRQDDVVLPLEVDHERPFFKRSDRFTLPGMSGALSFPDPIVPNGHFSWAEALHWGERMPASQTVVQNIIELATRLEAARALLGRPMYVLAWYRPEPWNTSSGGARHSSHLYGKAVDVVVTGFTGRDLMDIFSGWQGGLGLYPEFPQLLHMEIGEHRRWGFW